MDASVVVAAEQSAGVEVGVAALGPGVVVVGVAHGGWSVAVFGGAAFVADAHGDALGAVWRRRLRPRSRTSDLPPRTAGMMPAVQARRRASAAVIWPPVSRSQTPAVSRSARSWSRRHGDHDGGGAAAGLGQGLGGDGFDELAERVPVADLGRAGSGRCRWSCERAGEHRARSILRSHWPCRVGMRNRPWQVPASSSRMVNMTRRAAAASWSASTLPSKASARSGAITSNSSLPSTASALASWWAARPTRCCLGLVRVARC